MPVSLQMKAYAEKTSWIRKMFEEGLRLKEVYGAENVYDFSLGNPDVSPREDVIAVMEKLPRDMNHGYMPNAGFKDCRDAIAAFASGEYGVSISSEEIIMTCGAGGAMNVVLRSILDPGDEVIAIAPYFVEYRFYAENFGGKLVAVKAAQDFLPVMDNIGKAITARTRAIIINSPNNPTGRVYPQHVFDDLKDLLLKHPDIILISDEPYRRIVFDSVKLPSVLSTIPNSIVVTSASKDLSLAGQRIGYIALNPLIKEKDALVNAMIMANRILGFVNAPALMQMVVAKCIYNNVDVEKYRKRRDMMTSIMDSAGLSYAKPEGAFYLLVKSPIEDDVAFCKALAEERILPVPGTGFGWPGYIRFAYCVSEKAISDMAPGLNKVVKKLTGK